MMKPLLKYFVILSIVLPALRLHSMDIFEAARKGNISYFSNYINKGGNVNIKDKAYKATLLSWALSYDSVYRNEKGKLESLDMARLLIKAGADVNAVTGDPDWSRDTVLERALEGWVSIDCIELLVNSGADVNYKNKDGRTPLHFATWYSNADIAKLLIKAGAKVNAIDNEGASPLVWSGVNNNAGAMKLFLSAGADVNESDSNGMTTLMHIIEKYIEHGVSYTNSIQFLIDSGANVNLTNKRGETALIGAALFGEKEAIKILISAGADVNAVDLFGETALSCLFQNKLHSDYIGDGDRGYFYTRTFENYTGTNSRYWNETNIIECADMLKKAGADVNKGEPIFWASRNGYKDSVRMLVDLGADVNWFDDFGFSALSEALKYHRSDIADILKKSGAADPRPGFGTYKPELFMSVDSYAVNTPSNVASSFKTLASYLEKGATNDLEKSRVIFTWITNNISYDYVEAARSGWNPKNLNINAGITDETEILRLKNIGSPNVTLLTRRGICYDYSMLYNTLAREMGLMSVSLSGLADTKGSKDSHEWNTVRINGLWYFVDPTWKLFFIPPVNFVFTHFPIMTIDNYSNNLVYSRKWQLLDEPLPYEKFMKSNNIISSNWRTDSNILEWYVKNHGDIDARNKYGCTALMEAIRDNRTNEIKLLVNAQSDINAADNNGKSVLMYASEKGLKDYVRLFIEKGADINCVDLYGNYALSLATDNGKYDTADLLKISGAADPGPGLEAFGEEQFKSIDAYAAGAPSKAAASVGSLASYFRKGATNDLEKARVIFTWITNNISYDYIEASRSGWNPLKIDTNSVITDQIEVLRCKHPGSPEVTLQTRRGVSGDFSFLYNTIARETGLSCIFIRGNEKILKNSNDSKTRRLNNRWNAVRINGLWYIVNTSGGLFFPSPMDYVLSHLPMSISNRVTNFNKKWQLIDKPLSYEEFVSAKHR